MAERVFAQIDAFASKAFAGNQACIVPMAGFEDDAVLQAIAAENNVAETAFIVPAGEHRWQLRWFTPTIEVPLCGHATLASAHWLYAHDGFAGDQIVFETRQSGELYVRQMGSGELEMDFPAPTVTDLPPNPALTKALGAEPSALYGGPFVAAIFETAEEIRALQPDLTAIAEIAEVGCMAFDGDGVDVTSRFFAPGAGIPEDPATGSWHCMVAAIAGPRFHRALSCYQAFPGRGANLKVELVGDRVKLRGRCVTVIEGVLRY
ncbi:MAG: PhzF family phenazine biosynthesis protein [Pseudomonadota bacterium]